MNIESLIKIHDCNNHHPHGHISKDDYFKLEDATLFPHIIEECWTKQLPLFTARKIICSAKTLITVQTYLNKKHPRWKVDIDEYMSDFNHMHLQIKSKKYDHILNTDKHDIHYIGNMIKLFEKRVH